MRFTYNQYNFPYESGYRIPSKMHNGSNSSSSTAAYQHHHKSNFGMRMTMSTASTMTPRIHRKGFRTPSKRHPGKALPGKLHSISRIGPGKMVPGKRLPQRPHPPPCDNSNDSGFGFDQHVEVQQPQTHQQQQPQHQNPTSSTSTNSNNNNSCHQNPHHSQQHSPTTMQHSPQQHLIRALPRYISTGTRNVTRVAHKRQPATALNSVVTSSNGRIQMEIVSQPEQQHRARYQTEGSRGAVKDRSGNGFPIVRLMGYNKSAVLQVFIGTDIGRVAPHMFYQACKVAGKNSTQCNEKKVDGTMVIEIDLKPETEMTVTCDCVGILKERNVDVEHRFPDHLAQKNKKKSTRCRMVFRTQLTHDDGTMETLQLCSNPIICTQPPGVPEICKKSLNSCPVTGGVELFIIGKNFLKDTHVIFQEIYESDDLDNLTTEIAIRQQMVGALWEQTVMPDKEYLQQTHLICTVPPYIHQNILKPVTVQVAIISSGKKSESHSFVYTPKGSYTTMAAAATTLSNTLHGSLSAAQDATSFMDTSVAPMVPSSVAVVTTGGAAASLWSPTETKHEFDSGMMPPPITNQMPMGVRRPSLPNSTPMITDQQLAHLNAVAAAEALKTELLDENSADSMHSPEAGPHSPTAAALQYHARYAARKASIDAMMYETSNSLSGFPVTPAASGSSPMEVAAVEIAKEILHAAVAQQQQQQAVAAAASVDTFINNLTDSSTVVTGPVAVPEQSLFGAVGNVTTAIDHALTDILQQAGVAGVAGPAPQSAASVVLERSLSLSSNSSTHSHSAGSSPHSVGAGSSPSNSLNSLNSPITHDIILNSEPAATLNSLPMQQLLPALSDAATVAAAEVVVPTAATAAVTSNGLSTDIIMNPSVSPSTILRSANGAASAVVPNIMAPHQVTMANSILNDIAMQPQPTQQDAAVAALALSNIIMSPPSATVGDMNSTAVPATATEVSNTTTAVSNMIIKAAADFISNQEQQTHHNHHHLHHHRHQQHQQQQILSANTVAAANVVSTADPLVNLLLNHPDVSPSAAVAAAAAQASATAIAAGEVPTQFPLSISPPTQQESLIVALATENSLQKSVATNGAVVTTPTAGGIHTAAAVGAVAAAVPLPPPIPQELTTMSDQDLISYINPSTFDQI